VNGETLASFLGRLAAANQTSLDALLGDAAARLAVVSGSTIAGIKNALPALDGKRGQPVRAPQDVGDELRQVRAAAWTARLSALRATAEAKAAASRGQHDTASRQQELASSYHALHEACRQRETIFATVMADRADWDAATSAQRRLAVAADAELRRRHPGQHYPPLRSAEP